MQKENEGVTQVPNAKVGETIWVEKQITPATQWVEEIVKPLTNWMERKIHDRDETPAQNNAKPWPGPQTIVPRIQPTDGELITSDQASQVALRFVEGEILRVKLLNKTLLQYRVKMISNSGEIHLLYVDAYTGELIQPLNGKLEQ